MEPEFAKSENSPLNRAGRWAGAFIPPMAREATLGDLYEISPSAAGFAQRVLKVLPYIVFSQARRTLNLPSVVLQALVIHASLAGFTPIGPASRHWIAAALSTLCAVIGLTLRDVYRSSEQRTFTRAFTDMWVAALCILVSNSIARYLLDLGPMSPLLLILAVSGLPYICALRTDWGLGPHPQRARSPAATTFETLARDYNEFAMRVRRRNRIEVAIIALTVCTSLFVNLNFKFNIRPVAWLMDAFLLCIGAYLILNGAARRASAGLDAQGLLELHQQELARQHAIRCVMCWWWFGPMLSGLAINFIARGYRLDRPLTMLTGLFFAVLLCKCVSTINRKRGLQVESKIKSLRTLHAQLSQ